MQIKLLIAVINSIMIVPAKSSWTPVHNCILQTKKTAPALEESKIKNLGKAEKMVNLDLLNQKWTRMMPAMKHEVQQSMWRLVFLPA